MESADQRRSAHGDVPGLDNTGEHSPAALELLPEPRSKLVHPLAGVADHRDLEQRLSDSEALSDGPVVDVGALDREVLSDPPVVDTEVVQVLGRGEQDLTLGAGARVGAAFESVALDRAYAVAWIHAATVLGRGRPEPYDA